MFTYVRGKASPIDSSFALQFFVVVGDFCLGFFEGVTDGRIFRLYGPDEKFVH
jgi:hypothetical protein